MATKKTKSVAPPNPKRERRIARLALEALEALERGRVDTAISKLNLLLALPGITARRQKLLAERNASST